VKLLACRLLNHRPADRRTCFIVVLASPGALSILPVPYGRKSLYDRMLRRSQVLDRPGRANLAVWQAAGPYFALVL